MKIYNKEELEAMALSEIKKHLQEEIPEYIKGVKALIRMKTKPSVSIALRKNNCGKPTCNECPHGYYVYASFNLKGKTKQDYIGKYGEASTFEKIKVLAEDRPELIEMYEKLSLKINPV